jgi:hypothetical protein
MVIATVAVLMMMFGGGTAWFGAEVADLKDGVKEHIDKGPDRDAALASVKVMQKLVDYQASATKDLAKELGPLLADQQTPEADILTLMNAFGEDTVLFHHQLADMRFELKKALTREQWAEIYQSTE